MKRGFRVGDRVSVHGLMLTNGKPVKGRVVCIDRKSKYNETVVVLYDVGDSEMMDSFLPDGKRYIANTNITLGWPKE